MENTAIQKTEKQENRVDVPERLDQATYFTPLVDIIENNDAFIFQADLPGVKAGDVDISYENGVLTILGKAQLKNGVLELHVPKAEFAKTRKIQIKTS